MDAQQLTASFSAPMDAACGRRPAAWRNCRGVTLMELLVASTIGFVILLAIGKFDVTRVRLTQNISTRIERASDASMALVSIARDLERADRVRISDNGACNNSVGVGPCLSIRIPEAACGVGACTCAGGIPVAACFDIANSYRWLQYKLIGAPPNSQIRRDNNTKAGCGAAEELFSNITAFSVAYQNRAVLAPPGGEPMGTLDNNVLQVSVQWTDPQTGLPRTDVSEVTIRSGAYTNIATGLDGTGGDVNPPPNPGCCPGC